MSKNFETISISSLHAVVGGEGPLTGQVTIGNQTTNSNSNAVNTGNNNTSQITNPTCPTGMYPAITNSSSGNNYGWGAYSTTQNSTTSTCLPIPQDNNQPALRP
jgi:hypothetical protein